MSKLVLVTVKDVKSESYSAPMAFKAKGEAIRGFSDEVNNKDSIYNRHPADFVLFYLGTFDQPTGKLDLTASPESLGVGIDFIQSAA